MYVPDDCNLSLICVCDLYYRKKKEKKKKERKKKKKKGHSYVSPI